MLVAFVAVTAVAAAITSAIVFDKSARVEPEPVGGPAVLPQEEKQETLSAAEKRRINAMLTRFVRTAVERDHVDAAWPLVTPNLRGDTSRREWARGDIPVYRYSTPLKKVEIWNYASTSKTDVIGNVILTPPKGAKFGAIDFAVEVRRIGGRWRVDSFYPNQIYPPEMTAAKATHRTARSIPTAAERKAAHEAADKTGLNEKPLFVFLAVVVGFAFAIPLGVGLRDWIGTRWQDRGVSRRPLPPLPKDPRR